MKSIAAVIFILLHLLQAAAIVILLSNYHFVDPALYERVRQSGSLDTLDVAAQLGRFDLVSMLLGIIAVFIGIIAVAGFWMIRGAAIRAAENAAREEMQRIAPKYVKEWVDNYGRGLFEAAGKIHGDDDRPSIGLMNDEIRNVVDNANEVKGT